MGDFGVELRKPAANKNRASNFAKCNLPVPCGSHKSKKIKALVCSPLSDGEYGNEQGRHQ